MLNFKCKLVILLASLTLANSCAQRSYTKAHSRIVEEALERGEVIRNAEQDLELYESFWAQNESKLQQLLSERKKSMSWTDNYVIGPSDVLEVAVLGVEPLNTQVRVSETGFVSLPFVGSLKLGGLTEAQASKALKLALTRHLRDPEVNVRVAEFEGHMVSIVGAVKQPGRYALKSGQNTLMEALGLAGGPTARAGNFVTILPRPQAVVPDDLVARAKFLLEGQGSGHEERAFEISLGAAMGLYGRKPLDLPIEGGDTIVVQSAGQVLVEGEVDRRGAYALGDNMTLVGALAAAGGLSYGAKLDEVEVVRKLRGERVSLIYDLDKVRTGEQENLLLKNGDVVRVPSASGKRFSQDIFSAVQGFVRFGGQVPTR